MGRLGKIDLDKATANGPPGPKPVGAPPALHDQPGATEIIALHKQPVDPSHKQGERAYKLGQKIANSALDEMERQDRKFLPEDLQIYLFDARYHNSRALARLHVDAWRATYRGIMPDKVIQALNYRRFEDKWEELLSEAAPETFTFIAVEPELGLVGFVRGGPTSEPDAVCPWEVFAVNVAPRLHRRSIGTILFHEAVNKILEDGGDRMFCWVLNANRNARWFFKHRYGRPSGRGFDQLGGARLPKTGYRWDDPEEILPKGFVSSVIIQP